MERDGVSLTGFLANTEPKSAEAEEHFGGFQSGRRNWFVFVNMLKTRFTHLIVVSLKLPYLCGLSILGKLIFF